MPIPICEHAFIRGVRRAAGIRWTRDPFDRPIVGHAAIEGAPLATADAVIRENYAHAFWA